MPRDSQTEARSEAPGKVANGPVRWKVVIWTVAILAALILLGCSGFSLPLEFGYLMVTGWAEFAFRVLPQVSFNGEMIACGLLALGLAVFLAHRLLAWWARSKGGVGEGAAVPWRVTWTLAGAGLLLFLFGGSIAMTAIVHQSGWLIRGPTFTNRREGPGLIWAMNNARQIVLAMRAHEADEDRFPDTLSELYPDYIDVLEVFDAPIQGVAGPLEWLYFPPSATPEEGAESEPILVTPVPSKGRWIVGYSNGSVREQRELPPKILTRLPNLVPAAYRER